jgi:acyl-CoA ligase (AMP-forming) (exosortase A-associated)
MRRDTSLLHELVFASAQDSPDGCALFDGRRDISYAELAGELQRFASGLAALGVGRGERVAVYLDKRLETVVSCFGVPAHGAAFVPINPLLKAEQVGHILRDCNVRVLVTSQDRLSAVKGVISQCSDLRHLVVVDGTGAIEPQAVPVHRWNQLLDAEAGPHWRTVDQDMVAILYTSGSTGRPKGVVLSHRNMVAGAKSVASYLSNDRSDVLLAALPLSFDAGLSQLTTAFHAGAKAVLLNYLVPKDAVNAIARHGVTGLTAVPPLWMQLTQVRWTETASSTMRYFANTGGRMPLPTLQRLRSLMPKAKPFLMYGLTEAFRATYLPPEQVDRRPDSIGKAIPNSEILVLRPDGTPCEDDEPGELVQRGALVAQGYWNDPEKTAERFKPLPGRETGWVLPEYAVFSGDMVRRDNEGFLYFIGRKDDMIKSSGYRISPTEVEEALYATGLIDECAAFGIPDDALGERIVAVVMPKQAETIDLDALTARCKAALPAYMVPHRFVTWTGSLPRNANGKIDRKSLAAEHASSSTDIVQ